MIYAAIRSGCSAELTGLLLGYGADPHIPGPDGRSPYVPAVTQGRTGLAMLLRQHGADVAVTGTDRLLADRGADVEARDTTWDSTPMEWAAIGSGEQPASHPHPGWTGTVQALLDAGASARDITLSPDDPKPPSPEVAALLRRHGGQ